MRRSLMVLAAVALAMGPAAPALAGWKLIDGGKPVAVAKGALTITAGEDWNRWTVRPIKKGEVWTLDGTNLNELFFITGLAAGETMFRDVNKKERPLPKLGSSVQLTDIPEFVESSTRIALNTSVFELTDVQPATFAGHQGVRFSYQYAVQGTPLMRKGLGSGTIVGGKLHLIVYTAPALYFFDRDAPKVEAIIASARL
jgi:hypothetical protein